MRQLILENQSIKNGTILLESKDFKYLRQILRVKVGDMINIRLNGELQSSTVASIDDKTKKIILQICANPSKDKSITRGVQATQTSQILNNREYWLFQFIPRPQKFEQIVRQSTECGISVIVPIIGEYSEKSSVLALQGNKKERLEKIVKEARQQSGSPIETKVFSPMTLEDALSIWENNENNLGVVLSERNENSENLKNQIIKSNFEKICIAVGCEGGISPNEMQILTKNKLFHPVHFAVNILRCETAALYGIAAIQSGFEICDLEK